MTVIAHVVVEGVSQSLYDDLRAKCGWLEEHPIGGIAHLTWWQDGDCHNMDAWESEQALQEFAEGRLGPAMAAVGIDAAPTITVHPAHEVFLPKAQTITAT
jgi:hypothetical protein